MKHIISLKILTPEKIVYEDDVLEVVLPTVSGEIGIMPDHAPLVSIIKTGEVRITKERGGDVIPLSISGYTRSATKFNTKRSKF